MPNQRGNVLRSSSRLKNALISTENGFAAAAAAAALKRKAGNDAPNGNVAKKRAAFGDLTNNGVTGGGNGSTQAKKTLKTQMKKGLSTIKSNFSSSNLNNKKSTTQHKKPVVKPAEEIVVDEDPDLELTLSQGLPSSQDAFKSVGSSLNVSDDEEYQSAEENITDASMIVHHSKTESPVKSGPPEGVVDYDEENMKDPNQCSVYAMEIFQYYKDREAQFAVKDYVKTVKHPEVTENMRAILVDWLVEVQESFELNHETLYTAVRIVDLYLSVEEEDVQKENLQLIGATACLIACKTDERIPPLLDDFVYVCDDAYSREEIISMERKIVRSIDYDVGFPLSYRFLRRYGRVCKLTMPVLTFARYILETSLMEYELNIEGTSESKLATAALILAFKVKGIEGWTETLSYYSGYRPKECQELVQKLLKIIKKDNSSLKTIKQKYSHVVFHEVAKIELPETIQVTEE